MHNIRVRYTCSAALAALVLTACGGSPSVAEAPGAEGEDAPTSEAESVYAEMVQLSGQERRDELVACAEEEGEVNFYTSMNAEIAGSVIEAFSDTFEVDVNLYRASSETVLQRILQEASAGYAGNDVVETNASELLALNQEGLLATYEGERRDMVPEVGRFEGWTATRFLLFSPAWNTELIEGVGGRPTSWEDLADPRFDGQLAMEVDDFDWYLTLYGYWREQGKSDEEIDQLFAGMADGAKVVKGHAVMAELLSAGQYAVTSSPYTFNIDQLAAEGAPIEWQPPVEPVIARANGIGLMKTAENPCAAMLFTDWLLEEGQAVLAEEQITPAIAQGEDPLEGVELIAVDVEKLLNESDEWAKEYEALLRDTEQIE